MFFGKKKIKEKRFIDYVLEDIPFGLDDTFAMDQEINSSNCLMRTAILGAEKGAIENAAITKAIKSAYFLTILACFAEHSNINIPEDYQLYHLMMVEDAWGSTYEYRDGIKWAVRRGDISVIFIKSMVKNKFDNLLDYQKQKLLAFIHITFPGIVSVAHVGALIEFANKLTVKYQ
jgi:hypothetical protein